MLAELRAFRSADHELVINVAPVAQLSPVWFRGQLKRWSQLCEITPIMLCDGVSPAGPFRKKWKLLQKDGRLERIQTEISTDVLVIIFGFHPMIPKNIHLLPQTLVLGDRESGVTERAEIFSRIKAEVTEFADSTGAFRSIRKIGRAS